jgi:tetratricopeptide (TPR) repeat protein
MNQKNTKKSNFNKQLDIFKQDLKKAELNGDSILKGEIYNKIGKLYFTVKDYKEGLLYFENAIESSREIHNKELEAQYLGSKGSAFLNHGLPEEGYLCFEKILEIAEEIENSGLQSDALGSMALVHLETGDPGLAVDKLKKALHLAEEIQDPKRIMNQIGTLGNTYLHLAATEESEKYFVRAIEIAEEICDKESQAGYLNNLSIILNKTGRKEEAKSTLEKVKDLCHEIKDHFGERNALKILINMELEKNPQNELILLYLNKAMKLSQKLDDKNEENNFSDLHIMVLLGLNHQQEAIGLIRRELKSKEINKASNRQLNLLTNLGNAYYDLEKLDHALEAYDKGLNISKDLNIQNAEAKLLGRMGAVYADMGKTKEAKKYAEKSLKYATELENINLEAEQLTMLAMTHLELDQADKAYDYAKRAFEIYDKTNQKIMSEKVRSVLDEISEKIK